MSDFDGNFMWTPPSSSTPRTILTMLNQTDNGLNLMNEIFPQAILSRDHNDLSEQRPGLRERLASRTGFNPPTLETENISPFAGFFMNQTIPSLVTAISLGFTPSALLQSPMFSNSSQIILPYLNTNYRPLEMVGSSDEGNSTTLIFNNDLSHQSLNFNLPTQEGVASFEYDHANEVNNELPHQPLNVDQLSQEESNVEPLSAPLVASFEPDAVDKAHSDFPHQSLNGSLPPQQDFYEIPTEESVCIPSHVEPCVAPIVASFDYDDVDEATKHLTHQPINLYMPSEEEDFYYIPSPESNGAPLLASAESDTINEANNGLSHHALNVDLLPQEESFGAHQPLNVNLPMNVDLPPQEVNIISMEEESESEDEKENDEEKVEDHEVTDIDELNVGSSSSKKRKFEGTNMIGTTRKNKTQRVILQMESEEDNPDDGFHWRKYGQKVVKGNPNARSYYKCNSNGCKVKKHIERGAENDRLVITTYDGIHNHPTPPVLRKAWSSRSMNRSDSPMSLNRINRTAGLLSRPPSSFLTSTDMSAPFSSLGPQTNMIKLYMTGLSKLPSLPVNHQNSSFTYRNEEPMIDAIPDGTVVYNRIVNQVYANFGKRLCLDML